jgi:hypothetical protein
MRAEVLAQNGIIWFTDFAMLRWDRQGVLDPTDRETHYEFKIFGKCKSENSEHAFKMVVRVVNSEDGQ